MQLPSTIHRRLCAVAGPVVQLPCLLTTPHITCKLALRVAAANAVTSLGGCSCHVHCCCITPVSSVSALLTDCMLQAFLFFYSCGVSLSTAGGLPPAGPYSSPSSLDRSYTWREEGREAGQGEHGGRHTETPQHQSGEQAECRREGTAFTQGEAHGQVLPLVGEHVLDQHARGHQALCLAHSGHCRLRAGGLIKTAR